MNDIQFTKNLRSRLAAVDKKYNRIKNTPRDGTEELCRNIVEGGWMPLPKKMYVVSPDLAMVGIPTLLEPVSFPKPVDEINSRTEYATAYIHIRDFVFGDFRIGYGWEPVSRTLVIRPYRHELTHPSGTP